MSERLGDIVYQPEDRGTAAGALLGVLSLMAKSPDAIVVLTPSDHGVRSPEVFRQGLRTAFDLIRHEQSKSSCSVSSLIAHTATTAGLRPTAPHGSMCPCMSPGSSRNRRRIDARALLEAGAVWSTMVVAARGSALVDLYARHLPDLYPPWRL